MTTSLNYKHYDISKSALSQNYNLVCQCAHRCRLNKQSVSFYRSSRGRVIAYEPSSEVAGGTGSLPHWSAFASPPPPSQNIIAFPARQSGGHVTRAISCSNHVRETKKACVIAHSVVDLFRSWYTCLQYVNVFSVS